MTEGGRSFEPNALLEELRELRRLDGAPTVWREQLAARLSRDLETTESSARRSVSSSFALGRLQRLLSGASGARSARRARMPTTWAWVVTLVAIVAIVFGTARGSRRLVSISPEQTSRARAANDGELPAAGAPPSALGIVMAIPEMLPYDSVALALGPAEVNMAGNLITNGDFAHGDALWDVRYWPTLRQMTEDEKALEIVTDSSPSSAQGRNHALCVQVREGEDLLGGWPAKPARLTPQSFALKQGRAYRFTLRAWVSGSVPVHLLVKVGHQNEPYTASLITLVPVTATAQAYGVDFMAKADENDGGIAWTARGGVGSGESRLCIDDVALAPL